MKVLLVGATGLIGGAILDECILRPEITSIVAFSRRALPTHLTDNDKLRVVIIEDFASWSTEILESVQDADAMLW
jgi:uncharacterized protein YbjT (DUF2867 family)